MGLILGSWKIVEWGSTHFLGFRASEAISVALLIEPHVSASHTRLWEKPGLGCGDIARIQENQGEEGIVNDIKAELIKGLVG